MPISMELLRRAIIRDYKKYGGISELALKMNHAEFIFYFEKINIESLNFYNP